VADWMMIVGGVLTYVACTLVAYNILCAAHRLKRDLYESDAKFCFALSLMGPISIILAAIIYWIEGPKPPREDRLIARKRKP